MLEHLDRTLLLSPEEIEGSDNSVEVIGTFNPGAIEYDGEILLLVRIAERPRERREGFTALPRWQDGGVVVDWIRNDEVDTPDARVIRRKQDGLLRLTFTSHLRVFRSKDGRSIDHDFDGAMLLPDQPYEVFGLEDSRITRIDDRYWITYVAVSTHGAATALASTVDFVNFERHGIIFCPENKDVVLFPERIDDQFVALHRPTTAHPFCRPEIWIARSPDLLHWGAHQPIHGGTNDWESNRVGGGAPPIRTEAGWLEFYHASRQSDAPGQVGTYTAGVMLFDLDDPSRVIACSEQPLWEPDIEFEKTGFVPRVVFPTGVILRGDIIQLYYGAADTYTAMAEIDGSRLVSSVLSS